MANKPSVSVAVPVYNSAPLLPDLVRRLLLVLPECSSAAEIVLVDDGSRDQSWPTIVRLAGEHPQVRGIRLTRNFGQHNALLCGIRAAGHEVIVTLDDDLQQPPEEIPRLLEALDELTDAVFGVAREKRQSAWRNAVSRAFRALLRAFGFSSKASTFCAFRAPLRNAFAGYRSTGLFVGTLLRWGTTRFANVVVDHHPRPAGTSNYSLGKLLPLTLNWLVDSGALPLQLILWIGLAMAIGGCGALALGAALLPSEPSHGAVLSFLAGLILSAAGTQMVVLFIIASSVLRANQRNMGRPTYVVGETTGHSLETP